MAQARIQELEAKVARHDDLTRELTETHERGLILEGDVRELVADKQGLQNLMAHHRERQGMSDALNIQLSLRLESALGTVDRLTLALPAPAQSSDPRGFNWRFWQR